MFEELLEKNFFSLSFSFQVFQTLESPLRVVTQAMMSASTLADVIVHYVYRHAVNLPRKGFAWPLVFPNSISKSH